MTVKRALCAGLFAMLLSCTAAWADPLLIGQIDLVNTGPSDQLQVFNLTGGLGDVADSITFTNIVLTVNGTPTSLADIAAGNVDFSVNEPVNSITSLDFTASFLGETGPFSVNLTASGTELIANQAFFCSVNSPLLPSDCSPGLFSAYSGAALDSGTFPYFDIYANAPSAVPEPGTLSLFGMGLIAGWRRWRNRA